MSIRSLWSKLPRRKRAPTLARAEEAYAKGKHADAAAQFRLLAENGELPAQLRLAHMYERGEGVLQSFVEAVRWYRSAAEQNSVFAMARLGEIYLAGMAAPDTATPAALLRLEESANQGSLLKRLYPQGLAVPQEVQGPVGQQDQDITQALPLLAGPAVTEDQAITFLRAAWQGITTVRSAPRYQRQLAYRR